jgi:hypothetical protein
MTARTSEDARALLRAAREVWGAGCPYSPSCLESDFSETGRFYSRSIGE